MPPEPDRSLTTDEAFELFQVEAARVRMSERVGDVRIVLRSGEHLLGRLAGPTVAGHLRLQSGSTMLVPIRAVLSVAGSRAVLRDESVTLPDRSIASCLREAWSTLASVRVLCGGRWIVGMLALVAADHVELVVDDEHVCVPFSAVDAWSLPADV